MATVTGVPGGTIALLFTDIEGSTRLASEVGASWSAVLAEHHAIVGGAIAEQGGFVDGTAGDAFFATFVDARAAVRAAVAALRALRSHHWPAGLDELKVRMGLHVGYVERTETGYVGLEVHRAARVAAAAHGGQLLLTGPARALVGDQVKTEPLGAHRLKDFPSPELLYCAVVDGRGAGFFPPPRTQQIRATNLPAGLPALVGRDVEIELIRDAFVVEGERLVTVTGRGGAGKTSLALAAATSLLDEHPGGVWLARLATVTVPADVLPALADVIGAEGSEDESPTAAIARRLSGRGPSLLVLDNLEHLLAAAPDIAGLLETASEARVLITSQAPLRVASERPLVIDALATDDALALIERVVRRRSAAFQITSAEREVLAEIVCMLDGLPLALELAAARLTMLTPVQLRDRLRDSPDLLRDDMRDRSDRHRSLRAAVDWTLSLLDQPGHQLFVALGAFAGPVELEELEAVAHRDELDVLQALSDLLDVALVRRVESGDGRIRFGLPEALRQIAASMLDAAPDGQRWRRAHAARQHELQWPARGRMTASRPVLAAAVAAEAEAAVAQQWARAVDDSLAAPLAAARASVLVYLGRAREALAILEPLLDDPPADPEIRGEAQIAYADVLKVLGRPLEALDAVDAALALVTEDSSRVDALITRGVLHLILGQPDVAVLDHEQATIVARAVGADALRTALMMESQARMEAGQLDQAAELLDEAEEIALDTSPLVERHTFDGDLALLRNRPREAMQHYSRSLELAEERNNHVQIYNDLFDLADALAMNNNDLEALEIAGIAEAQILDQSGSTQFAWHVQGRDFVLEAEKRLGAETAAKARKRGREVSAGYRVTRARELVQAAGQPVSP